MTPYTIRNHVKTALFASIGSGDTSFSIVTASSPFNNPPSPSAGRPGVLTMTDNMAAPTKIEHITYSGISDNGDGTLTLTGVTRGAESTTAQSWTAGALIFQAPSSGLLNLDAPWPVSLGGTGLSALTTGSFIRAASASGFEQRTATQVRGDISAAASGAITGSGLTIATARIAGRTTASTGALEEIAIGAGLVLAAGVLSFNAAAVAITGGTIGGISSLGVSGAISGSGDATLTGASSRLIISRYSAHNDESVGAITIGGQTGGHQKMLVGVNNAGGYSFISSMIAGTGWAGTLLLQPMGGSTSIGGTLTSAGQITANGGISVPSGGIGVVGNIGLSGVLETTTGGITARLQSSAGDSRGYVGTVTAHSFGLLAQGALLFEVRAGTNDVRSYGNFLIPSAGYIHHGSFGRIWSTAATQVGSTSQAGLYGPLISYNAKLDSGWKAIGGGTASAITIDEGYFSFATSQSVSPNQAITWTSRFVVDPIGNATINGEVLTIGTGTSAIGANVRFKDDGGTSRWLAGILGGAGQRNWVLYDIAQAAARITVDASTGVVNTNKAVNSEVGFTYDSELDKGNSTASDTVNWPARHRQRIVISQNTTLAFTSPGKPCSLILKLVTHSSSGSSFTVSWPASIKWAGGVVPDHRTGNSRTHVYSFYFDGTNYFGAAMLDCA